ncbi:hypothetical protein [Flavobacterium suzhouense]|uniref:Uncharacterized protein n=1 Tax=Flavobacterium suzhouense TaxID=1529638 RepID=A0ABW5NVL6_9FLAO
MPKLTTDQIVAIDKALWDIEIRFLDIRVEMIDHAATSLEGMEGDFNVNLERYIADNKRELRKNYRQFKMNAWIKGVKLLFSNLFTVRFMLILAGVYALLYVDYSFQGREGVTTIFVLMSALAFPVLWIYYLYVGFTKQKKQFSTAERLLEFFGGMLITFCFLIRDRIDKAEIEDTAKLLYYAFIISFYVMMVITYRFLIRFYNSRYQVA